MKKRLSHYLQSFGILLLLLLTTHSYSNDKSIPSTPVKIAVQLLDASKLDNLQQTINTQKQLILAVSFINHPHWHTYWDNPGDAGQATKVEFFKEDKKSKLNVKAFEHPAPLRYIEGGDIQAYGYENGYSFFYLIPKNIGKVHLKSSWLVCKHICLPGSRSIDFTVSDKLTLVKKREFDLTQAELKDRFLALPKTSTLEKVSNESMQDQKQKPKENTNTSIEVLSLKLTKVPKTDKESNQENKKLALFYKIKLSSLKTLENSNLLYPFPSDLFSFHHEKLKKIEIVDSSKQKSKENIYYGKILLDWDGDYLEPPRTFPKSGQFKDPVNLKFLIRTATKSIIINKTFTGFELDSFIKSNSEFSQQSNSANKKKTEALASSTKDNSALNTKGLWYYLFFAFLGGLILNLMPCVLPVISIKLFALIEHSQKSRSQIFKHNFYYSLGVYATFGILIAIVLSLKAAGTSVGWGFQLQSPYFVLAMCFLLFIFALNLFGLFELRAPGGSFLGGITSKDGFTGDFLNGVIATILSTPCTAPFLGSALAFAFSAQSWVFIAIFFAVATGLSFPFLITGIFPQTIAFLPKPGMWMVNFKKLMGLSLLLTTLWLIDIYLALTDTSNFLYLSTSLVLVFFLFYLKSAMTKKKWPQLIILLALIFVSLPLIKGRLHSNNQEVSHLKIGSEDQNWEKWQEVKMNEYLDSGKTYFIDFTAKWCFNCKVNEKLVLNTSSFSKLAKDYNVKLLLADWTKRDESTGKWLLKNGAAGVPAYFIIKKGKLFALGESISISKIKKYLEK